MGIPRIFYSVRIFINNIVESSDTTIHVKSLVCIDILFKIFFYDTYIVVFIYWY